MRPDQDLPGQFSMSIGGESIPFTMQAEVSHMTIDEAIASGLFDMPDEPGMVRIPISINVMIPNHLLWPPQPPEDHPSDYDDLDDAPPPMTAEGHAARKIAESFRTMIGPDAAEARASFRDMLKVMHGGRGRAAPVQAASADRAMDPRRPDADRDRSSPVERFGTGLRTPDGTPIQLATAQAEPPEEEERIGPEGRELDPAEASNTAIYQNDVRELAALDPRNDALKMLRSPNWIPDDADVARIEQALAKVRARAAGPAPAAGRAQAANPKGFDDLPLFPVPSYRDGESDGGPGRWVANSRQYPSVPEDAAYQQRATGAPPGMEYQVEVPTTLMPSGRKSFDSYDPSTGNLIDAKRYVDWPKEELDFSMEAVAKDLNAEAEVAKYFGRELELRVATPEKAKLLRKIIEGNSSKNVVIVVIPAK